MSNQIDNDMKEIITSFVSEGYDRIEDVESKMPLLETADNPEIINTIFRLFHSIKGSAGYLNFENIKNVTHEAETLLDIFRKTKTRPSQKEIDLLYQTLDFLRQLIQSVEQNASDSGNEQNTQIMVHNIKQSIESINPIENEQPGMIPEKVENPQEALSLDNLITQEMQDKFYSEALDILDSSEKHLLDLDKNPKNKETIQEVFRNIHTLKGNAGFFGYSDIENKSIEMENLLDLIRKGQAEINNSTITNLLQFIDIIRHSKSLGGLKQNNQVQPAKDYKMLGEILVEMGEATAESVDKALEVQNTPIGELLIEKGSASPEAVEKALEIQSKTAPLNPAYTDHANIQRKEIRVDTSKLDKLFDLVGELITAEAMVANCPELQQIRLENFNKAFNALNKISREIQEIAMMVRMIPLEGLFTKMVRLVRDLSRKSNKKIYLSISGQDTEMDKNVIDMISDPLVHLLRNSIDHGIEEAGSRLSAGKPETGNISLSARYEGSEVWIIISDDGVGLNREKILRKAVERGLIAQETDTIPDKEVWAFIFEAGFSTADKVSEISGRGVGMDVVKKNIDKLRGKIDIQSQVGKGTQITLKIPLTMAIIDGITVRTGTNLYSIPIIDILEFFKAKEDQLTETEKGRQVINLRGTIIPLISLFEVFNLKAQYTNPCDGIIIVIHSGSKKACLLIDEIIGNQQIVIKSLSDYLGKVDGISGCSILGDGQVSFIIDTGGLINKWVE